MSKPKKSKAPRQSSPKKARPSRIVTPNRVTFRVNATYTRSDMSGVIQHAKNSGSGGISIPDSNPLTVNPNWKVKVLQRVDASSPRSMRKLIYAQGHYTASSAGVFKSNGVDVRWSGQGYNQPYIDPTTYFSLADDVSLRDLALKRLKSKLANRTNQINLLIPVAELRDLHSLIHAVALSGIDLVNALIAIKKSKGASVFQFASHAWLNWSFAIAPTLSEIQAVCASIDTFMTAQGSKFTDYGVAKKSWFTSARPSVTCCFGMTDSADMQIMNSLSYRYTCGYHPKVKSANDYGVGAHFGLEFGAMIPAVWELTPFSWLLDYFATMGDYLEDTFVSDSVNTIYVNLGKKYTATGRINFSSVGLKSVGCVSASCGSTPGEFEFVAFDRTLYSQLPSRQLRFKSADEVAKGAVNKLLNLASILIGSKGRHFKTL